MNSSLDGNKPYEIIKKREDTSNPPNRSKKAQSGP